MPGDSEPAVRRLASNLHCPKDLPVNDQSYVLPDMGAGEVRQLLSGLALKLNLDLKPKAKRANPLFLFQVGLIQAGDDPYS